VVREVRLSRYLSDDRLSLAEISQSSLNAPRKRVPNRSESQGANADDLKNAKSV